MSELHHSPTCWLCNAFMGGIRGNFKRYMDGEPPYPTSDCGPPYTNLQKCNCWRCVQFSWRGKRDMASQIKLP